MQPILDFLKQRYEKILLALSFAIHAASAIYLSIKVESITQENIAFGQKQKNQKAVTAVDLGIYSNAIAALQSPPA